VAGPASSKNRPEIAFDTDVSREEFYKWEDFEIWMKREKDAFKWIFSDSTNQNDLKELRDFYSNHFDLIIKNFSRARPRNEFESEIAEHRHVDSRSNIISELENFFKHKRGITSDSPIGRFVIEQKDDHGEIAAVWSLNTLMQNPSNDTPNSLDACQGIARAAAFERSPADDIDDLENRCRVLAERLESLLTITTRDFESLKNDIDKNRSELANIVESGNTSETKRTNEFDVFLAASKKEVGEIKDLYIVKKALEEPVIFWSEKAKIHVITMWISGVLAILIAGGLLYFIYQNKSDMTITLADLNLGSVIFLMSVTTFVIWLIRLSAKIFVANMHLRDDAQERVTMMQAFLALSKNSEFMSASDTGVIFNALFRPASSGLVKDEGVNSPIEIISKIVEKSSNAK